jgi:hypothetical protein
MGYLIHYNAINYYRELITPTISNYRYAVVVGYSVVTVVFIFMMVAGYHIFGLAAQPLILNNFHPSQDTFATIARISTAMAIIFGYPLMFAGFKSSIMSIINKITHTSTSNTRHLTDITSITSNNTSNQILHSSHINNNDKISTPYNRNIKEKLIYTLFFIAIIVTAIKCTEHDVSLVIGVVGSLLGTTVAYTIPGLLDMAYCKLQVANSSRNSNNSISTNGLRNVFNWFLILSGIVFAVLGVVVTIKSH